jgi:hypothetical protein
LRGGLGVGGADAAGGGVLGTISLVSASIAARSYSCSVANASLGNLGFGKCDHFWPGSFGVLGSLLSITRTGEIAASNCSYTASRSAAF